MGYIQSVDKILHVSLKGSKALPHILGNGNDAVAARMLLLILPWPILGSDGTD
jgi:hypothetical protein